MNCVIIDIFITVGITIIILLLIIMIICVTIIIIVRSLDRCFDEGQAGLVCFDSCILAAQSFTPCALHQSVHIEQHLAQLLISCTQFHTLQLHRIPSHWSSIFEEHLPQLHICCNLQQIAPEFYTLHQKLHQSFTLNSAIHQASGFMKPWSCLAPASGFMKAFRIQDSS